MSRARRKYLQSLKAVRRLGNRGAVASHFEAARALVIEYPREASAHLELGIALTETARYKDARKAFDASVRLCKPDASYIPFYWKGHLYREQGRPTLAERWYRRSIESRPNNPDAWAFLGGTLAKQGRFLEAKKAWRKMVSLGTGATEEGHLNIGFIYRAECKYKLSLRHAEKALRIDPDYGEAKALAKDIREVLLGDA